MPGRRDIPVGVVVGGQYCSAVEFRVLGPVGAYVEGAPVPLGGPQQRRLLAAMLSDPGRIISFDSLTEVLWPAGDAPPSARRTIISYVSRLRAALGDGWVTTTDAGYAIETERASVDHRRFLALVDAALVDTPSRQVEVLDEALALWRGPVFGELGSEWWARPLATRLDERRLDALVRRVEALSATGWDGRPLGEARSLVATHPTHSPAVALLMRGLNSVGRTDEALSAYQAHRRLLAERSGLDPPQELVELDRSIAVGVPGLRSVPSTRSLRGYQIEELLGEGGYGRVYRATQPALRRDVAIKVIRPDIADDHRFVRRFEIEAQLVASVEHPHIVPLYDFWREPGAAYLVFRILRGGSGRDVDGGRMSLDRATSVVDQIGSALAAAHRCDVIHRDVKPSNILFDEEGAAYLADFGIATADSVIGDTDDPRWTNGIPGSVAQSPYASPEQIGGGQVDARSDQFGLATTMFQLLTGDSPWSRSDDTMGVRDRLPSVSAVRPDLPRVIDEVLARATAMSPSDRFADIAAFVDAWHAATSAVGESAAIPVADDLVNPYKGLRPFRVADTLDFHGRRQDLDQLLDAVARNGLTAVVGPSGSGKSSLVLAGVMRAFQDHGYIAIAFTPGTNPFAGLAAALDTVAQGSSADLVTERAVRGDRGAIAAVGAIRHDLADDAQLLIVVDQFEELWTSADASEHHWFTRCLADLSSLEGCRVVVTIRADWYDRPLQDPNIGSLISKATFGLAPMSTAQLREAIVAPAESLGVRFDPELVGRLVSEAADQPGTLPLLQFALAQLFDRRNGSLVEMSAYDAIGGLGGAIAAQADRIDESLPDDGRAAVRELFARLVTVGEGTADTRRRVRRADLVHVPDQVIDAFVSERLLTIDRDQQSRESTVEIAHESLLTTWPRLRHWLSIDREWLREVRGLASSAALWSAAGRQPADLYRGARLAVVEELLEGRVGALTPDELDFLTASRAQLDAERNEVLERVIAAKRQNRRLRRSLLALAAMLVLVLAAGAVAIVQRGRADEAAGRAREQRAVALEQAALAATRETEAETERAAAASSEAAARQEAERADAAATEARAAARASALENLVNSSLVLRDSQQDLAALLAIEAYRLEPSGTTRSGLFGSLTRHPGFMGYRHVDDNAEWFNDFVLVGDGSKAFGLYRDDRLMMIDVATGQRSGPLEPAIASDLGNAPWLAVSGDGRFVVEASGADAFGSQQPAAFRVYDAVTGATVTGPIPFGFTPGGVAMSSDGSLVAVAGGRNAEVAVYRVADGGLVGSFRAPYDRSLGYFIDTANVTFGPDDRLWVGTTSDQIVLLDPVTVAPVASYAVPVGAADFGVRVAPGGDYLIAWGSSHVVRVDLPSGAIGWDVFGIEALSGDVQYPFCSAFALVASANHFYCGDAFGTLREFDVSTGQRTPEDFGTQVGNTAAIAVSADGSELVAASGNTPVYARWRLDGSGPIQRIVARDYPNGVYGYDASGSYLLVSRPSGTPGLLGSDLAVWEVGTDSLVDPLDATPLARWAANPAEVVGAFLGGPDGVVGGTYDVTLHRRTGTLDVPIDLSDIPIPQADPVHGQLLLKSLNSGQVRRFDTTGEETLPAIESGAGNNQFASLTADGSVMVVSSFYGGAAAFDTRTGEQIGDRTFALGGTAVSTQDVGVSSTIDGRLLLFDPRTLKITGALPGSGGAAQDLQFSADGSLLMVKGGDRRVTLYDMKSGLKIGDSIGGESALATTAALRPDGLELAVPDGRSVAVWDLRPDSWIASACSLAGRNLTRAEWDLYLGDLDTYRLTCPDFPAAA